MKHIRNNEDGYVLTYVVIVIFILCSIAIVLMSSTLNGLVAQENMVKRMQEKYEAQGEVEEFVAKLENVATHFESSGNRNSEVAIAACKAQFFTTVGIGSITWADDNSHCVISYVPPLRDRTVNVNTKVKLTTLVRTWSVPVKDADGNDTTENTYSCSLDVQDVIFHSYQIISVGGDT